MAHATNQKKNRPFVSRLEMPRPDHRISIIVNMGGNRVIPITRKMAIGYREGLRACNIARQVNVRASINRKIAPPNGMTNSEKKGRCQITRLLKASASAL